MAATAATTVVAAAATAAVVALGEGRRTEWQSQGPYRRRRGHRCLEGLTHRILLWLRLGGADPARGRRRWPALIG